MSLLSWRFSIEISTQNLKGVPLYAIYLFPLTVLKTISFSLTFGSLILMCLVVVFQLLSCIQIIATPWTATAKDSLSFTISQGLLNFMSIESMMPSNHPVLCPLFSAALSLSQHQDSSMSWLFASCGHSIRSSVSVRVLPMNTQCWFPLEWWYDFLDVQGTLKSLLQHHNLKASIIQHSAFFMVQLSHPYMTLERP